MSSAQRATPAVSKCDVSERTSWGPVLSEPLSSDGFASPTSISQRFDNEWGLRLGLHVDAVEELGERDSGVTGANGTVTGGGVFHFKPRIGPRSIAWVVGKGRNATGFQVYKTVRDDQLLLVEDGRELELPYLDWASKDLQVLNLSFDGHKGSKGGMSY